MEELKLTDNTVNGKCSGCGACCSDFLPLSDAEIKRIKVYAKAHGLKEQRHNFMVGYDMTCPFRDDANKKCLVYEVRPAICRQFVCNHTMEDIMQARFDFHQINRVVSMRSEFFGSAEHYKLFSDLLR